MQAGEPRRGAWHARYTALGSLLAFCVGCGSGTSSVNDFCPVIDGNGGNPVGDWKIDSACQVPYPKTSSGDWCSKLVYDAQGVQDGLFLGQDFLPIIYDPTDPMKQSKVSYKQGDTCGTSCGTYTASLIFEGPSSTFFPAGCLSQHTSVPTCTDLTTKMQTLIDANVLPTIQNVTCTDKDGGCECSYLVTTSTIVQDLGAWRIEDGLLVHYPSTLAQPSVADFSVVGDHMELHGHDGTALLAHDSVRTLTLTKL